MTAVKSKGKKMLTVPIDADLYLAFKQACASQDTDMAKSVREYIRRYVAAHGQGTLL